MAALYCEAAENAAKHGLQVGYHNHDWDLIDVEGTPGYQVFLENTPESVLWEADIFWVARAGLDIPAFIKEIGARGKCLHFKDGIVNMPETGVSVETAQGTLELGADAPPFVPAGCGHIDIAAAAAALTETEYIAVELDNFAGDMMAAVKESYDYLTTNGIW